MSLRFDRKAKKRQPTPRKKKNPLSGIDYSLDPIYSILNQLRRSSNSERWKIKRSTLPRKFLR